MKILIVDDEASIDGKNAIIAGNTTKTKSSYRTLPLVPSIRAKLLAVQAEQEANRKLCGKAYNKAEGVYIYTDALGNRIKPDYLSGAFPQFLEKHGFRKMRFHDLRHPYVKPKHKFSEISEAPYKLAP